MISIFVFLLFLITISAARPATTHTTTFTTTTNILIVATAISPLTGQNFPAKLPTAVNAQIRKTTTTLKTLKKTTTSKTSTSTTSTSTSTALSTITTTTTTLSSTGYASTTTFLFTGTALPSGLTASNYVVDTTPLAHYFTPRNVYVGGGYLNLLVPGGQSSRIGTVIQAGEVSTDFTIASASVETYAILTNVAGVVNGMFYYEGPLQETDIEWLSSSMSNLNKQTRYPRAIFYTDQSTISGGDRTQVYGSPPINPTNRVHNYQLVWMNNQSTSFYINGARQTTLTTNVPSATDGRWFWNNWSSGDPYFSVGPPLTDAVFRIQKIVMKYNPGP